MASDTGSGKSSGGAQLIMRVAGTLHRGLYRLTGGKLGAAMGPMKVLLLTTTGRKSGQERTWPLGYFRDGNRLIVAASANGQPEHPAWFLNLRANPRVTVQVGQETRAMTATTATGEERERLWAKLTSTYPNFAGYQKKTTREIPVVILAPVPPNR